MADTSRQDFINNLPRMYGMYTGGFIIFILIMAVLEQLGVMQASSTAHAGAAQLRQPCTLRTAPRVKRETRNGRY